jgi:hypothetical protein
LHRLFHANHQPLPPLPFHVLPPLIYADILVFFA